ncbi:MAG: ATP-binding protein [Clostridiales bacterium]|nr:ATP-binding protein [Clostridiales bacterium]
MKRFINREEELGFLERQYVSGYASMVVLYGRRRLGKTSLIHEFARGKPFLYFLATEEAEHLSIRALKDRIAEYTGDELLAQAEIGSWDILFQTLAKSITRERLVLAIDEFQYLGKVNPAFPTIFQRIWDTLLQNQNIMVILCGSLVHMMESQTLAYASPLYGRRTGQIRLRQIDFQHYGKFYDRLPYRELVERYAVTGGTPKYIELFEGNADIYQEIERHILDRQSLLFEEPVFLLQHEVSEIGSYFSILRSIAAGNHRLGKICADLGVKETSMPKYLRTLIDMHILEREVPVTEKNPERSKMGLYRIRDHFLRFWFLFVYPEKARLELSDTSFVMDKIRASFVENHAAYVYEYICQSEMWRLAEQGKVRIGKLGRWWNNQDEIDIVGLDNDSSEITFGECKFRNRPMDVDVFESLLSKKELVLWNKGNRTERFILFSISGFTDRLRDLAANRGDLLLFEKPALPEKNFRDR